MYLDFFHKDQVLQEESLDSREDTTWTTFLLEYSVWHFLIEKEALAPRVVKMALIVFK